ncbi:MAG: hypothetical protein HFH58_17265 [Lachnospiraceae bacterium]|jgi:Txe/YoeB family toxin of Txe-Axe toxin-antitoxin module|nr:hypothetical protein [Lachnospiraceae bacterium]
MLSIKEVLVMARSVNVNFRMDEQMKKNVEDILAGLRSRCINGIDRLTYKVLDDIIVILACKGHYE